MSNILRGAFKATQVACAVALVYIVAGGFLGFLLGLGYPDREACVPYESTWILLATDCSAAWADWSWFVVVEFPRDVIATGTLAFIVPHVDFGDAIFIIIVIGALSSLAWLGYLALRRWSSAVAIALVLTLVGEIAYLELKPNQHPMIQTGA